jgi:hypothetical protein
VREVLVILYIVLAIHLKLFVWTIFIITGTSKNKKWQQTEGHTYHKDHKGW